MNHMNNNSIDYSKPIGEIIKQARKMKKMSLRALTEKTGISWSYIAKFEDGSRPLTNPSHAFNLSLALGLDYKKILEKMGLDPTSTIIFTPSAELLKVLDEVEKKARFENPLKTRIKLTIDNINSEESLEIIYNQVQYLEKLEMQQAKASNNETNEENETLKKII